MTNLKTIDDLAAAPYNPREISDAAARGLQASLDKFGDISGITWNCRTSRLVTGHQRVTQLREIGATLQTDKQGNAWLEVGGRSFRIRVVDWDEAEEKAANITANNAHISGSFTAELDALLGELQTSMDVPSIEALRLDALLTTIKAPPEKEIDIDPDEELDQECPQCGYRF